MLAGRTRRILTRGMNLGASGAAVYGVNVNNPVPLNIAEQNPFIVDPSIMSCFIPEEHAPMGWFRSEEDIEFEEYLCASSECELDMFAPESDDVKRIAIGDTTTAPAVMWELQRYIYDRLQGESVQNASVLAFLADADTSSIGAFYGVSRSISELLAADSVEIAQLQANLEMTEEKLDSLLLIDELLPDADSLEFVVLQNDKNRLLNTLHELTEDNRKISEQLLDLISDEAGKLRAQNDSITVTEIYEANEKGVNDLYLSWLSTALGALDSIEMASLQSIAEQCPIEGGSAVYRARAFWAALTREYVTYNDSLLCVPAELLTVRPDNSVQLQTAKNEAGLRIFPNPAQTEINIVWDASTEASGSLSVYDVFGRQVLQQVLSQGTNTHALNIRDLPDGLYFFRIRFQDWDAIRKIIVTR